MNAFEYLTNTLTSLHNHEPVKKLGSGNFGTVVLTRMGMSELDHYAIKLIDKTNATNMRRTKRIVQELVALSVCESPFVLRCSGSSNTARYVTLVLPYCGGGDLRALLKKKHHLSVSDVVFYAAEIAEGLRCIHGNGIAFRDLKPENILLSADGHVRITDFGLCRLGVTEWREGAKTTCGTPQYVAPEIYFGNGYGLSCDWWSYGVCIYEFLSGLTPYKGKIAKHVMESMKTKPLVLLRSWPDTTKVFVRALLTKRPWERLGANNGGLEIMSHEFFHSVEWDKLRKERSEPPIIPTPTYNFPASDVSPTSPADHHQQRRPTPPPGDIQALGKTSQSRVRRMIPAFRKYLRVLPTAAGETNTKESNSSTEAVPNADKWLDEFGINIHPDWIKPAGRRGKSESGCNYSGFSSGSQGGEENEDDMEAMEISREVDSMLQQCRSPLDLIEKSLKKTPSLMMLRDIGATSTTGGYGSFATASSFNRTQSMDGKFHDTASTLGLFPENGSQATLPATPSVQDILRNRNRKGSSHCTVNELGKGQGQGQGRTFPPLMHGAGAGKEEDSYNEEVTKYSFAHSQSQSHSRKNTPSFNDLSASSEREGLHMHGATAGEDLPPILSSRSNISSGHHLSPSSR